ncbi:hypothetical protein P3X46_027817 [Hevea brasiliensis]|uniref:C2 domain-containing protein n=1 Tax=Hevea brasiliensis TaxID=3981 RepID=A0ABQ9L480_HEVBR|nr:protein SRC2 [Hevea brasiliensis]KAJ9154492.1 hypothetical protein P3X46_027817 [Hevea brasiliensis]
MEQRTLEINVISAKDLKDVNLFSKMDVYAVVSISGDSQLHKQKTKTPVDRDGGTNPTWNFPARFTIHGDPAQQNRLNLVFKLRCDRALGDKDIGEVNVPIKELFDSMGDGKSMQFVSYQVRKPSGKPKGELNFSFKFGDKVVSEPKVGDKADQPVTAYPAAPPVVGPSSTPYGGPGPYPTVPPPPVAGYAYPPPPPPYTGYPPPPHQPGYGYPPPPPGYGYPPAPQAGYGYPPAQAGYGYPPVQQPPKKNKFGMGLGAGLGAGLLGGALGGLLIGDMVSDAGAYDAGYDAGFDDAGGF